MIYLKYFESERHYYAIDDNDFYIKIIGVKFSDLGHISHYDYRIKYMRNVCEGFTNKEIFEIEKIFKSIGDEKISFFFNFLNISGAIPIDTNNDTKNNPYRFNVTQLISTKTSLGNLKTETYYRLIVVKLKDEWYYVSDFMTHIHYKCDQFEGLTNLLKDILYQYPS